MISLRSLLLEVYGGPKAIILAGGAGVGKSTFTNTLTPFLPSNFKIFNPDTHNPDDDPNRPNIAKNSADIRKNAIPDAIKNKQSFVYDTTGQNFKETVKIIQEAQQAGFKVMMIMLYASPIVSFLRNFSRDRTLPKDAVLNNWAKVYGLIDNYKKIPNLDFALVQTELKPNEKQDVAEFNQAYSENELEEYFKHLIQTDPTKYYSSFRKPKPSDIETADDLPDPEEVKAKEERKKESEKRFSDAIKNLKDQFKQVEKYLKIIKPMDYKQAVGTVKTFTKP